MLNTAQTPKSGGMLNNAFMAVRRLQTPTTATATGTGRHRGRPATERRTSINAPGTGTHRRPTQADSRHGNTAAQA